MKLITNILPELIGELTKQINYAKFWANGAKEPEDITEDCVLE